MKLLFALLVLLPAVTALYTMSFEEYCTKYNKRYNAKEHKLRREIFEHRVAQVNAHNLRNLTFSRTINHLTDHTDAELATLLGFHKGLHHQMRQQRSSPLTPRRLSTLQFPESVDWTTKGVLTPVKNQGGCGSCWAFAGTEAIESCVALSTKSAPPVLAPQQFVDCVEDSQQCGGTGGCEGATPDLLFNYAVAAYAVRESDYPYKARDGTCQATSKTPAARVGGYVDVENNNYEALMAAVVGQPVTVGVAANEWFSYGGGVFSFDECGADVDHAVLLVGYGTDPKLGDYWKVQNSWGDWGENGYIRLARSAGDSTKCQQDKTPLDGFGCKGGPSEVTICGTCGILFGASYPVNCTAA